jgi:hypothetical protein
MQPVTNYKINVRKVSSWTKIEENSVQAKTKSHQCSSLSIKVTEGELSPQARPLSLEQEATIKPAFMARLTESALESQGSPSQNFKRVRRLERA